MSRMLNYSNKIETYEEIISTTSNSQNWSHLNNAIDHSFQREEELKIKEAYLKQLKSIDVQKYSSPNE